MSNKVALIIGAGPGISLAFAKQLIASGYTVALASRDLDKLKPLAISIGAESFKTDASSIDSIQSLFESVETAMGEPEVVLFNPSARVKGEIISLDPNKVSEAVSNSDGCFRGGARSC